MLPETKDILVDIDGDVTITLISSERDFAMGEYIEYYYDIYSKNTSYYYDLVNTLKTMAEYNDYIKVRFIDPFAVYSQKFLDDNSKHKLQYGDILINCYSNFDGNAKVRNSVISANELFEIKKDDSGKKEIVGIKAEETISKKLKALRSKRDINVAYISELCEETDIVKLKKYLSGSGYNFDEISLKDSKLQGYDMILIVSPMRDVTLEEMVILDSFLENNGKKNKNLMLFCPKEYIKLENLYSFVSKWGIGLSDEHRLTSTGDGYFSDPTQIYGECEQTEYTKNSTNENGMYIMDMCTPILIEETGNPIYTVKGLLYSKSDKLNWMNINEDSEKINLNDKKYPLFVLSEKQVDKKISRVGVCSSTDFITTYFALQIYSLR